jgi:hypothetical protein
MHLAFMGWIGIAILVFLGLWDVLCGGGSFEIYTYMRCICFGGTLFSFPAGWMDGWMDRRRRVGWRVRDTGWILFGY